MTMAKAIPGDPALDTNSVRRFDEARNSVASAVDQALASEEALRNLSQDTLDLIEMSLRQARIDVDRGLLVFAQRRTIRGRQSLGGALGALSKRVGDLEAAVPGAEPDPSFAPAETPTIGSIQEHEAAAPLLEEVLSD
jgi:hypothetical protein